MIQKTCQKVVNTIKTDTKNAFQNKKCGYNTHIRKTRADGIVQLILSSIEHFLLFSFVGSSKAVIFEEVELFFELNGG